MTDVDTKSDWARSHDESFFYRELSDQMVITDLFSFLTVWTAARSYCSFVQVPLLFAGLLKKFSGFIWICRFVENLYKAVEALFVFVEFMKSCAGSFSICKPIWKYVQSLF